MEISSTLQAESSATKVTNKNFWQTHVKQLNESGLTRAKYARVHHLNYRTLNYWCKKAIGLSKKNIKLVAVKLTSSTEQSTSKRPCQLYFRNGCHLIIHDLQTLSFILERMN